MIIAQSAAEVIPSWIVIMGAVFTGLLALTGLVAAGIRLFNWGVQERVEEMQKAGDVVDKRGHDEVLGKIAELNSSFDRRCLEEDRRLEVLEDLERKIQNGLADRMDDAERWQEATNDRLTAIETRQGDMFHMLQILVGQQPEPEGAQ